mmetsp:Transcript_11615/g.19674  ORF Transcript_11615/g.19674 Transcript_11615/m.19674 type:complete len:197 (+) Transcript_11615:841-1431(+)
MRQISIIELLCVLCLSVPCSGYRVGDVVDTFIKTESKAEDVMRNQMPVFGASSKAVFNEMPQHFSLSFEEGLRPLPWVSTTNNQGMKLSDLEITFVYSKSGDGVIHSISSKPNFGSQASGGFEVRYHWVEEEEVDPQSGMTLMFLVTFLSCVVMLINSCAVVEEETAKQKRHDDDSDIAYSYQASSVPTPGVPKWD